ncbi:MAG: MFS transporter [Chloroflexi bacterium]|nr:MFS transporter [Chloroflexota bacterium]
MNQPYRWLILALTVATAAIVVAVPAMAVPVLSREIANELHMDLVQVGLLTTTTALMSIALSLAAGAIGDRFGARNTIAAACFLAAITGALRGLSDSFAALIATTLLFGLATPLISINLSKTCAIWFAARERGRANGALSAGMALGFLLGSLLSASVLSPLLGGWRHVLFALGGAAALIGLLWLATRHPEEGPHLQRMPALAGLAQVTRMRNLWIMALGALGYGGCVNAALAYLPLYLRDIGWSGPNADQTVAAFHAVSLLGTIPIGVLSDRLGKRRGFLLLGAGLMAAGTGTLAVAGGGLIVAAVLLAGVMRDGFMTVYMTTVMETKGVGAALTGSAIGFVQMFFMLGGVFSPPLGNSLVAIHPAAPFVFWAALAAAATAAFTLVDTRQLETHSHGTT